MRALLAILLLGAIAHADDVGGPILINKTWTKAGSPHTVVADVVIGNGATLTIEPGVVLRFKPGIGVTVGGGKFGPGGLMADGTADEPIVFTSSLAEPAPGDWDGIFYDENAFEPVFNDNTGDYISGPRLHHCIIEYAGGQAAINTFKTTVHVQHCDVSHIAGSGFYSNLSFDECVVILDSDFSYCAGSLGGGVSAWGDKIIKRCTFMHNQAGYGAGLALRSGPSMLQDLVFHDNHAAVEGGGLHALSGHTTASNLVFTNNSATYGGGFWSQQNTVLFNVTNVNATNNTADYGGAGYITTFTNGTHIQNATFVSNSAIEGGAIYIAREGGNMTSCSFINNTAVEGGAVFAKGGNLSNLYVNDNHADFRGGGLRLVGEVTLEDSVVSGNTAERGGGLLIGRPEFDKITIDSVDIVDNISTTGGGGLRSEGAQDTTIKSCLFEGNVAGTNGGAIMLGNTTNLAMQFNQIRDNTAAEDGGAIWAESTFDGHISGGVFENNTARRGAEVFYATPWAQNGTGDLTASSNCWNTHELAVIKTRIWDHDDDPALGAVDVVPFNPCGPCPADCDGDGDLDVLDFVCFQLLFQDGAPEADCTNDGQLSILDFVCFQLWFQDGC